MQSKSNQLDVLQRCLLGGAVTEILLLLAQNSGVKSNNNAEFFSRIRKIAEAFTSALDETEASVPFRYAAEFSLLVRSHRRPSTRADLRSYINRMCEYFTMVDTPLRVIKIADCRSMLNCCFGHSAHAYRKAQSVLCSIFNCGIRQGWCSQNPTKAILRPPVKERRIEILTMPQIRALLQATQLPGLENMEDPLRLMLWCGIRPMEVRRLRWCDIDAAESVVYIEGQHSKTGGARAVSLRGGAEVLKYNRHEGNVPIAPRNWERLWQRVRKYAGFDSWQNDALRHTFASMHLKCFHDINLLQEEMEHRNSTLLQTRYLNLRGLRHASAKYFFQAKWWR